MSKSKKGILILIVIIILILLLIIGGLIWYISTVLKKDPMSVENTDKSQGKIGYEATVIVDNPDALQDAVDGLIEQAAEGTMTLEMKTEAVSADGLNFKCQLGNAQENRYEMFMVIYRDDTQEEIYRSGLLPIGTHIESFTTNKPIDEGVYEGTIVYNQVEDDQETIHSQVNIGITLMVDIP